MKQLFAFVLMMSALAFSGENKQHDHSKMDSDKASVCEVKDGEKCTSIALPTAQCGMCEKTISTALNNVKGVTMANVDAKAKIAHVHFSDAKIKIVDLEKAIAAAGYDANDTVRDDDVHAKLPQCCQMTK